MQDIAGCRAIVADVPQQNIAMDAIGGRLTTLRYWTGGKSQATDIGRCI